MPTEISKTPATTKKPAAVSFNREQFVRQAILSSLPYALGTTGRADTKDAARLAVQAGYDLTDAYEAFVNEKERARKARAEADAKAEKTEKPV